MNKNMRKILNENMMSIAKREDTVALTSLLRVSKTNLEEEEGEYHSDKNSVDLISPNKKRVDILKSTTKQ